MSDLTHVRESLAALHIIDTDAHITEPPDLWTSRAPAAYRERLPRVREIEGQPHWVVGENVVLGPVTATSVVAKDGSKARGPEFFKWRHADVHRASYDMQERVRVLDQHGLYAQVIYPNLAGFGNQNFLKVEDSDLRLQCAAVYNDAMAEIQRTSGGRILPMALMPWWNIGDCVKEIERASALGLRGIVMCSDPDSIGMPDLSDAAWTPFWEICDERRVPVNFHIAASQTSFNMFGRAAWPSMGPARRLALGSTSLFMENARVLGNLIYSGLLERFPNVKIVSVESGIGWIPFLLEALDYEWEETGSQAECALTMKPSDYFRRQVYGCFWFERVGPRDLVAQIGEDNLLFETDFPHPTCLYPNVQAHLADVTAEWSDTTRRKILQDNAAALYGIQLPH
ncbi:MAG TPA: amidohydrolase family protein [Myxococcota bacterium]|jgi:predicted TIM-barrel fold metal-dependent hydrolase